MSRSGRSTACWRRRARTCTPTWASWSSGRASPRSAIRSIRRWRPGWCALWFALFPIADWSFYLLAMTMPAIALWIAWRLAADYLDAEKRVLALALLMLVPFFNFHALKFNPNHDADAAVGARRRCASCARSSGEAPCSGGARGRCAAARDARQILVDLPARRAWPCGAARSPPRGLFPVGCALGHDRGRRGVARAACRLARQRTTSRRSPTRRLCARRRGQRSHRWKTVGYLGGSAGLCRRCRCCCALAAMRPSRAALPTCSGRATPERRLAAIAFWAPLLLPALVAPLAGIEIWLRCGRCRPGRSLPVVLLSSPLVSLDRRRGADDRGDGDRPAGGDGRGGAGHRRRDPSRRSGTPSSAAFEPAGRAAAARMAAA